ncbi:LamG domain-containing protein [Pseudaquabacterium pictum]|uniref:LamG-like jellyroll fold domain-containing protein n=1 Tax=Pseudaquabacterium pictum TaxID=2315236 RepID=A0A480AR93_9BURK|nr:LamG domain-containing protein [Rubrivivax pictus]GCL62215.1 hypothetical protein AQPW35_12960 [Rubrivivax pictus]
MVWRWIWLLLVLLQGPAALAASYIPTASANTASAYPWIDIATTGTALNLGDDAVSGSIPIGFSFALGNRSYTTLRVDSNGTLQFASATSVFTNTTLPLDGTSGKPNIDAVLLPLWDDLLPGSGQVRYRTQGTAPARVFIVSWINVPYYGGGNAQRATFQVQLHEQGQIVYRYGAVDGSGGAHSPAGSMSNPRGAVVGLEVSNSDFVQYARQTAAVPSGTTILWSRDPGAPVLEYLFNEASWNGSSGEVRDTSGSGLHGTAASLSATKPTTASATPALGGATGTCGYGVFNRSNKDHVAVPADAPNHGAGGSFTISAWIRATDASLPAQRIVVDDQNNNGGYGLSLGDGGAGTLRFLSRGTPSQVVLDSPSVIASNTWYFVAASVDTATRTKRLLVYNSAGSQLAAVSATYTEASFGSDAGDMSVGGENNAATEASNAFGFGGNIDEVRIFGAALSTTQLDAVRLLTTNCTPATLVAEYRFEESAWNGTAGELKDSGLASGGPYNGRAQGSGLPSPATTSPARTGNPGTCGYATLPGPTSGGGSFVVNSLPVVTTAGAQTTIGFWMYWNGIDSNVAVGWNRYLVGMASNLIGFNTDNGDLYGTSASGLANGWHHVVAVFTNGGVTANRLYINGSLRSLSQVAGTPVNANAVVTSNLTIGGYGNNTNYRFTGRIDEVVVYNGALSAGEVTSLYQRTRPCFTAPDHLEIRLESGTGLTCAPATLTVVACKDASCSALYDGGLTGSLTATGAGMSVAWPDGQSFRIPAGSGSTTLRMQLTTAGSVVVGANGLAPAPTRTTTCNFGSPQCTFSAAAAALRFDVPDHRAESAQPFSVSAVGSSGGSCNAAFASSTRTLRLRCSYVNPGTGTLPVRVGGTALNSGNNSALACDGTGRDVSLAFDASGVANATLLYADAGQVQLNATYTGSLATADIGLTMTGSDRFITAPASFGFSGITAGPIRAGNAFAANVTARNSTGSTTPNFGRETPPQEVLLGFSRFQPTGSGASDGSFSGNLGSFSGGSATASDLAWTEVGSLDLSAALVSGSYLGTGMAVTGSTGSSGAVGRFIPHHFDVALTPACGAFSYAGQPFTATVTARNAFNDTTVNYDGGSTTSPNHAKLVTLANVPALGLGSLSGSSLAASVFRAGVGSGLPAYSFSSKTTAPQSLVLRATDTDSTSSSGHAEPAMPLRSGRLRLANAFGQATAALQLAATTDYWNGSLWQLNSADSCTALAASSVALSNPRGATGAASTATSSAGEVAISSGSGLLTLTAPSPAGSTLSLDIAVNLGSTGTDQSCNSLRPASTGAGLPWLRAQNGSCAATADRDPAARASFGIFAPETRKTVHVRDLY